MFQVPCAAVPAEVTDDYDARTRINGWRRVVLTVGVLISGGLTPAIVSVGGSGRAGYALMGWTPWRAERRLAGADWPGHHRGGSAPCTCMT